MARQRPWVPPLVLIAFVTAVAVGANYVNDAAAAVLRAAGGVTAVGALYVGSHRNHAVPSAAWKLLTLGIGVWVLGDALWDGLTAASVNSDSGLYHIADALYLTMYPVLLVAIVKLVRARGAGARADSILDGIILSVATVLVVYAFLVAPQTSGNALDRVITAAYPFGDALLLAGLVWLALTPGSRSPSLWLLSAGVIVTFGADIAWDLGSRFSSGAWDAWINPWYPVGYALVAAAALHPSVSRLTSRVDQVRDHVHPARLVFLGAALLTAPLVALWGDTSDFVVGLCAFGLVVATALRFAMLVRSTERARRVASIDENRFRLLAAASPVGIYEVAPDLELTFANDEAGRLFGRSVKGMTAPELLEVVDPRDRRSMVEAAESVMAGRRASVEFRLRAADGTQRWVSWHGAPVHEGPGSFEGAFASTLDISALKDAEDTLARQASHDPLTDLPNRRLFLDEVSAALQRLREEPGTIALLFLDLDRFKLVNDLLGHDAGDELLKVVAERIVHAIRADDTAARFGGDEFVVLLEHIHDRHNAARVAEQLMRAISDPIALEGTEIDVTTSIGISLSVNPGDDPDALVRDADAAMYQAKQRGRAQFRFFDGVGEHGHSARIRPGEPGEFRPPGG